MYLYSDYTGTPSLLTDIKLEDIAIKLEAIDIKLEAVLLSWRPSPL